MDKKGIVWLVILVLCIPAWMIIGPQIEEKLGWAPKPKPKVEEKDKGDDKSDSKDDEKKGDDVIVLKPGEDPKKVKDGDAKDPDKKDPDKKDPIDPDKKDPDTKKEVKIVDRDPVLFGKEGFIAKIDPEDGMLGVTLSKYKGFDRKADLVLLDENHGSFKLTGQAASWKYGQAEVKHNGSKDKPATRVEVTVPVPEEGLVVKKTWEITEDHKPYQYSYKIELINVSKKSYSFGNLRVNCGHMYPDSKEASYMLMYDQGVDYATMKGEDVYTNFFTDIQEEAKDMEEKGGKAPGEGVLMMNPEGGRAQWVAVKNQYFTTIVDFRDGFVNAAMGYVQLPKPKEGEIEMALVKADAQFEEFSLQGGSSKVIELDCYIGPQKLSLLKEMSNGKKGVMSLSQFMSWKFAWLGFIAEILLVILVFFIETVTSSFGIAIILLTLTVKAAFWHMTQKGNESMKKMQVLGPKMKEIREQYKDNPQVMNQKIMEMYRTEGINPLGGCLPMLLQMPIYFALFSTIRAAIELRHQEFLWAVDLAKPDTIFVLFGMIPIRPFVLLWVILMMVHQRMSSANAEPMQRRMMMFMTVIMLLFCYGAPSGLTLYFSVQALIGIVQYKLINRKNEKSEAKQEAKAT